LKLPSIDAATADELLAPFIKQALQFDTAGTLLAIVRQFGWQADGFTTGVDLGSFSLLLQVSFGLRCGDILFYHACQPLPWSEGTVIVFTPCSAGLSVAWAW
jgi:hypothetical protein